MKRLEPPESQLQEVLFELINRFTIDRRTMMLSCGVWNLTAHISKLRLKKGLNIESIPIESVNKYGRDIVYTHYKLINKKQGKEVYNEIQKKSNERKIPSL